jgi:nucleoside-diphosphate-sugar epimerase
MGEKKNGKLLIVGGAGYIGSAVKEHLTQEGWETHVIGKDRTGKNYPYYKNDVHFVRDLRFNPLYLDTFEHVIYLGGVSSVGQGKDLDRAGASISDFVEFCNSLPESFRALGGKKKLLYASSASVYGKQGKDFLYISEGTELHPPVSYYDWTKQTNDRFLGLTGSLNAYSLRFGTVCGYSPNPRIDVFVPSLLYSWKTLGYARVSSPAAYRTLLGMRDLCWYISGILASPVYAPGVYNLGSVSGSIGDLAQKISEYTGVPLLTSPEDNSLYSFEQSMRKIQSIFGLSPTQSLGDIVEDCLRIDWEKVKDNPVKFRRDA